MKLILKVILLTFVLFFIVVSVKREVDSKEEEPLVSLESRSGGGFGLKIREKEKNELKNLVKRVENLVYREATLHNPPGDLLPDQIDDQLKQEVKKTVD